MADLTEGESLVSAERDDDDGCPVIRLTGELDLSGVDTVRPVIDEALGTAPQRVVFDIGGLEFMDSSGIALMLSVAAVVERVEVRSPTDLVRRVIELTGLTETLIIT